MTAAERARKRRQALARFFTARERDLERVVTSQARSVDRETILDACAFAWLKLVRRPDILLDQDGFYWLATVAIHEAWRVKRECRETPYGMFLVDREDDLELSDPVGPASDPLELVLAAELQRDRIARFACL
jgi:DNA-directed RNA polymerase specialized sigma24 family protein